MASVSMKYGKTDERIEIEDQVLLGVAVPPPFFGQTNEAKVLLDALANPIGTPLLKDLAKGKRNAVILISDFTRPTPSKRILPFLLKELAAGGLESSRISVVIATGLHEIPDDATSHKMLGDELMGKLSVTPHDPDAPDLIDLGKTSRGTPLKVNRIVAEADLRLSISTVDPHHLYGWSGGAKNIIPGTASRETVYYHHGRTRTHKGGIDRIEGNIFREDAEEAARMAGLHFILNVNLNEDGQIAFAAAGDVVGAHRKLVERGRKFVSFSIPQKPDIMIVGVGGPPRDADFWQAQGKGLLNTAHAIRDGGIMILVAQCDRGMGTDGFRKYMLNTLEEIRRRQQVENFSVPLFKAFTTIDFMDRCGLYLVAPALKKEDLPHFPVQFFSSVREALTAARRKMGPQSKVLAVPDGSRVVIALPG